MKRRLAERSGEFAALDHDARAAYVEDFLDLFLHHERVIMPAQDLRTFAEQAVSEIVGLGPLEPLLRDPNITEIMVNGPRRVFIERDGRLEAVRSVFDGETHLYHTIDRVIAPLGLRVDESHPMVDARLPDGGRVNVIVPPLAIDGPAMTIRRFAGRRPGLDELVENGTLPAETARFLTSAVAGRRSILISGGTGSGKTTLLNALASKIAPAERLITIEDTAELKLPQPNVVSLESRGPNIEGAGEVTVRALVRNALRMRPDRIIVGEVRGGEALDMLQAMNTGHEGSLSTAHANSCADALKRLEVMVLMSDVSLPHGPVREQIAAALDLIVQTARGPDGRRRVVEVAEVAGMRRGEVVLESVG